MTKLNKQAQRNLFSVKNRESRSYIILNFSIIVYWKIVIKNCLSWIPWWYCKLYFEDVLRSSIVRRRSATTPSCFTIQIQSERGAIQMICWCTVLSYYDRLSIVDRYYCAHRQQTMIMAETEKFCSCILTPASTRSERRYEVARCGGKRARRRRTCWEEKFVACSCLVVRARGRAAAPVLLVLVL